MQPMPGGNPYEGAYRAPPPPAPAPSLSAFDALGFGLSTLMSKPGSIMLGVLFLLIPIVGPISLLGWQAEILRRIHTRAPDPVPVLNFDALIGNFNKGLPVFLVQLVWTLVVMAVLGIPAGVIGGAVAVMLPGLDNDSAQVMAVVLGLGSLLFFGVVIVVLGMVLNGALIRAELSEDFSTGISFSGAFDIARKTFGAQLIAALLFVPMASLLILGGLLLCFVGIYPAVLVLQVAASHYRAQVYALYLHRGGYAVPMRQQQQPPQGAWGY